MKKFIEKFPILFGMISSILIFSLFIISEFLTKTQFQDGILKLLFTMPAVIMIGLLLR